MKWKPILVASLAGGAAMLLVAGDGRGEASPETTAVAVEECADCHEEHVAAFLLTPHSVLDTQGWADLAGADTSCAACHGDPTTHLDEGGGEGTIFSFGAEEMASDKSENCQSCHASAHPRWDATSHARAGLDCTSCHSIHEDVWRMSDQPELARSSLEPERVSDTCTECHDDVFAQFQFNDRHRLQEGILECTSCHDVHEPSTRWMLGGFKDETCADCHVDKMGPFVFEHGSVRGEDCTACHTPHGSPNRHMLTFQNVAELCYSCHAAVPGFHSRFVLESQCTNCHSTIHGSHLDPFFLK